MAVTFQLIFNGNLDRSINKIDIMPKVAEILEIDPQFLGGYFTGKRVVLIDNAEFKRVQKMQKGLESLGIYCDIKPVTQTEQKTIHKPAAEQTSSIKLSKSLHYKSTFKTPDTDQYNVVELNLNKETQKNKLKPIDLELDETLYTKDDIQTGRPSDDDSEDRLEIEFSDKWKD